jgi:hypothetical protein
MIIHHSSACPECGKVGHLQEVYQTSFPERANVSVYQCTQPRCGEKSGAKAFNSNRRFQRTRWKVVEVIEK